MAGSGTGSWQKPWSRESIHGERRGRKKVPSAEAEGERNMPPSGVPAPLVPSARPGKKTRGPWALGRLGGKAGTEQGRQCGNPPASRFCAAAGTRTREEGWDLRAPRTICAPLGVPWEREVLCGPRPMFTGSPSSAAGRPSIHESPFPSSWWEDEKLGQSQVGTMFSCWVSFPRGPQSLPPSPLLQTVATAIWDCVVCWKTDRGDADPQLFDFSSSLKLSLSLNSPVWILAMVLYYTVLETMWTLCNPRAVHEKGGLRTGCKMNWASFEVKGAKRWGTFKCTGPFIQQTSSTTLLTVNVIYWVIHLASLLDRQLRLCSSYSSWYSQHYPQYLIRNSISKIVCMLFTTAKTWKPPQCPSTEEWIKKMYIYTMEYHSAIKKNMK